MTAAFEPIPRRGSRAHRLWVFRALLIGALPLLTAAVCVASLRVSMLAAAGIAPWTDLSGPLMVVLVGFGVIGLVALFDRRTRVAGAVALLLTLVLNPITYAIALSLLGLR